MDHNQGAYYDRPRLGYNHISEMCFGRRVSELVQETALDASCKNKRSLTSRLACYVIWSAFDSI